MITRILVYRLGSLGDTVLALPCFNLLRMAFPLARIVVLTNAPVSGAAPPLQMILSNSGLVDDSLEYPVHLSSVAQIAALRRRIAAEKFDLAVDLAAARGRWRSLRDLVFFKACGIGRVAGIPFAPDDLRPRMIRPGQYEWEASRLFRRVAKLSPRSLSDPALWDLRFTTAEVSQADELLNRSGIDGPFIALAVGSKVPLKDWGIEKWSRLISGIRQKLADIPLVFFGAKDDHKISAELAKLWPGKSANLAGQASPRITAAMMRKAALFVGIDSGPMHLAGCVGVPCVAIFTARAYPGQWWPPGENHQIIYHQTECFGCELVHCTLHQRKCITSITVEEVAAAIMGILNHVRHCGKF